MVATAGYIAGHVAQPDAPTLEDAYATALHARVTGPIGMADTTLSFDDVIARANYATPHGALLRGGYAPIPLALEQTLEPIAPAGALLCATSQSFGCERASAWFRLSYCRSSPLRRAGS
jgi:hypothetical protein